MSHEPECPTARAIPATHCARCKQLRAAYKRGREDAAKAVWSVDRYSHSKISDEWFCKIDDALIAAIEGKPSSHLRAPDALARWKEGIAAIRGGEQE